MIPWTLVAIAIGLGGSLTAFFKALSKLRKQAAPLEPLAGSLRWISFATILLYLSFLAAGSYVYLNSVTTQHALCTFRDDLTSRVAEGEAYLKAHPKGFAGIPAATIQATLANQKRSVDSLSSLNCP